MKQKKIPKTRESNIEIDVDDVPYKIPENWLWVSLAEIGHDWGQKKPDIEFTYIDVSAINKEQGIISDELSVVQPNEAPSRARKIVTKGTVIYSTVRPYLLNIAIVDRDFEPEPIVSTAFAIIHPFKGISNKYIYYYLRSKSFIDYVESQMLGMAYPAINDSNLFKGLVPLPPTTEQKRIVEKCDRLLSICDEIEKRQQQRQESIVRMNESAIAQLLSSENPDDFRQHWQRICNNFDLLYSIPETIPKLRQAILQLAVMGKLVRQDPNDEPASVLLEKIQEEKNRLIQEKLIKNNKVLPSDKNDNPPYIIPHGWKWVQFQDITSLITCGIASTPKYTEQGKPFLSAKNVKPYKFMPDDYKFVSEADYLKITQSGKPEKNDILLTRVGAGIGEAAIIDQEIEFAYYVSLTLIKPCHKYLSSKFLLHWLNSPEGVNKALQNTFGKGVSQGNLNVNQVRQFTIPLPPLAEQERIVEKCDRLMSLCDTLEAKLKQGRDSSKKLMEVAAKQVLIA